MKRDTVFVSMLAAFTIAMLLIADSVRFMP